MHYNVIAYRYWAFVYWQLSTDYLLISTGQSILTAYWVSGYMP